MEDFSPFPSKLLLFGEYAILKNKPALAIPFQTYSGQLSKHKNYKGNIDPYLIYLKENKDKFSFLAADKLNYLLQDSIGFDSNIPIGYGLGSSAALTASIASYCIEKEVPINILKNNLAAMESYFHGSSSGMDPLVSYLKHGILCDEKKDLHQLDINLDTLGMHMYLYDSNLERNSKGFVQRFLANAEQADYSSYFDATQNVIKALRQQDHKRLIDKIDEISHFQLHHMSEMIPTSVRFVWSQGHQDNSYTMKLCGAGGGGYFLAFSTKELDKENFIKITL